MILVQVLDWMLGKGHGVLLRRAELKTFVTFHGNEVAVKTWLLCVFLTATFLIFYFIFGRLGKVEIWQPMRLLSSQVHLNWQKRQQKMQWLPFPTRSPLILIQLLICGFLCFMFRALFIFLYSVMLIICFHLQYRETLNTIMSVGHSRVPVYFRNPSHIIGLILVPIFNSFRCCISFLSFGYLKSLFLYCLP